MQLTDGAHLPVVVVGGGQAGLATSRHLVAQGLDHLVLEADRVGSEWRNRRWDSFCLVTPNWQCRLPAFPRAAMGDGELADHLARHLLAAPRTDHSARGRALAATYSWPAAAAAHLEFYSSRI